MKKLIKRAKNGDAEAFIELIEINKKDLYKIGKAMMKSDDDILDAMQETILSCWKNIKTLKKDKYFKTWLIKIMINKCKNILDNKSKYVLGNEIINKNTGYEEKFDNIEWNETLNSIDEKYRLILLLYYVQGFKTPEIAQMLNLKENTVRTRLKRGRLKFANEYSENKKIRLA